MSGTSRLAPGHVAVVGAGVMGSWTALHLARRGYRVTLLDAYGPGSSVSTSGDESRVTRSAHGSDHHYPRWQRRSLDAWQQLERDCGERLFVRTGVLWLARDETGVEADSLATLNSMGIAVERLSLDELTRRWPQISTSGLAWGLFEPEGGVLMARRATAAAARAAELEGAEVVRARALPPAAAAELALADGSTLQADALVFACGPWLAKLFPRLLGTGQLTVTRQEVIYVAPPPGDGAYDAGKLPTWVDYAAAFYGLPSIEGRGMKVAPDRPGPIIDPDEVERRPSDAAINAVHGFVRQRFPGLAGRPVAESRVCQYESTPDAHFVIDRLPDLPNAWVVGGGSGHAFKHGPVIGEYVAALIAGDEGLVRELAPPDDRFALRPRGAAGAGLRTAAAEA